MTLAYSVWACRQFFQVSLIAATVRGVLVTLCGYLAFWMLAGLVLALLVLAQRG